METLAFIKILLNHLERAIFFNKKRFIYFENSKFDWKRVNYHGNQKVGNNNGHMLLNNQVTVPKDCFMYPFPIVTYY